MKTAWLGGESSIHISIDIETLGVEPGARITQIGAVAFELDRGVQEPVEIMENPERWLDVVIAPYPQSFIDPKTVAWWNEDSQRTALELINSRPKESIRMALGYLDAFCQRYLGNKAGIWAKPPGFDCALLGDAYKSVGMEMPWGRRQESCVRTIINIATKIPRNKYRAPDFEGKGLVKHYALHDAAYQAIQIQAAYRALIEHNHDRRAP